MQKIKFFTTVALLSVLLLCFAACNPYKEQAGVYELTVLERNGTNMIWLYDYYRLDIKANGDCTESYKRTGGSANFRQTTVRFESGKMIEGKGKDAVVFEYENGSLIWIYSETTGGETSEVKMIFTRTKTT